jgi:hypothetical protein
VLQRNEFCSDNIVIYNCRSGRDVVRTQSLVDQTENVSRCSPYLRKPIARYARVGFLEIWRLGDVNANRKPKRTESSIDRLVGEKAQKTHNLQYLLIAVYLT